MHIEFWTRRNLDRCRFLQSALAGCLAVGFFAANAVSPPESDAACCYFAAKDKDINQPGQKAFISWDPEDKLEAIRLMSKSVVNTVERPAVSGIWIAAAALSWAAWAATPIVAYDDETSRIARANFRINGGPPQCVSPHGSPPRCTSPVGVEGAAGAVVQPQPRLCG